NWLPTAVHTIAGLMVGKLFLEHTQPIRLLAMAGSLLLIAGYGLDVLQFTPIIKPIASSSFIMASLGYCLWIVMALYWWIDIRKHRKGLLFFQVVGMNSIFIYLFFDIVGKNWLNDYVHMLVHPLFATIGFREMTIAIWSSICVFALEWALCYFLYRKKIFFKL